LKSDIDTFLQSQREFGFIVNVVDPTFNSIDASFSFTTQTGYDAAATKEAAETAVADYLNPATFGAPPGDARGWSVQSKVYLWEIVTAINNVIGVERLTSLTLGLNGGTQSAADVTLTGSIPLPRPGTIVGTPV
jgi:hypothetical protein